MRSVFTGDIFWLGMLQDQSHCIVMPPSLAILCYCIRTMEWENSIPFGHNCVMGF